jgi:hypothetical protein
MLWGIKRYTLDGQNGIDVAMRGAEPEICFSFM